jgi:hypothetical protein
VIANSFALFIALWKTLLEQEQPTTAATSGYHAAQRQWTNHPLEKSLKYLPS